jgi:superfamily II DNA/RNA helicase
LAQQMLADNAQTIAVAKHTDTHANIEQRLHWVDDGKHKHAILEQLLAAREIDQALVFTSTQQDADWLADRLAQIGHPVASLHGGMPQGRRNRVLQGLRQRNLRVLVATDVAARGIDVPSISHVINWGLPMKAEDYVHRIGRTGRAGRSGLAITLAERRDIGMIKRIQQFTTQQIPVATLEGFEPRMAAPVLFNRPARPHQGERREWNDRPQREFRPQRPQHPQRSFNNQSTHHAQRPPFAQPRHDSFVRADQRSDAPQGQRPWPARDDQRAPKRDGGFHHNPGFKPGFKAGFKNRNSAPAANNPGFTKRPKRAA